MASNGSTSDADQSEPHPTVQSFVDSHLVVDDESGPADLEELWNWYGPRPSGVPKERFKWHLIQALPESIEREQNTFYGVGIKQSENAEIE